MNTIKKYANFDLGSTESTNSIPKAPPIVRFTVNLCRLAIGTTALVWLSSFDILKVTVALLALALTMLPKQLIRDEVLCNTTKIVFAILLAAHIVLGMHWGLYETSLLYDKLIHTLGSSAVAGVVLIAVQRYFSRHEFNATPTLISVLVVSGTISAGTLWEFFEYAIDSTGLFQAQRGLHDTMLDLIADALGAVITVAVLFLVIWIKGRAGTRGRISTPVLKRHTLMLSTLSILIAAVTSNTAFASDSTNSREQHIVELTFLAGDINHDFAEQGFDDVNSKHIRLAYHFQFQSGLYLGVGYLSGESGEILQFDNLFGADELEYNATSLKAGYRHFSSKAHSLYAEVSIQDQNVSLNVAGASEAELDGIGWSLASGWRYQLSNNVGFKLGLENLVIDKDISILSISGGISYSF